MFITNLLSAFLLAFLVTIGVVIFYFLTRFSRKKKLIAKIRKKGRVVTANLMNKNQALQQNMGSYQSPIESVYEYYYKKKRYTHKEQFIFAPPETLKLFINGNPAKACTEEKVKVLTKRRIAQIYLKAFAISVVLLNIF